MAWFRPALLALLIAGWAGLPARAEDPVPLGALNLQAAEAYGAGDRAGATALADKAVARARDADQPTEDRLMALNNRAFLDAEAGAVDDARALWREAIALADAASLPSGPGGLTARVQLATSLSATGDHDAALALAAQALVLARGTPFQGNVAAAHFGVALAAGQYQTGIVALGEAIATAPDLVRPVYGALYVALAKEVEKAEAEERWTDLATLVEGQILVAETYYPGEDKQQALRNLMHSRFYALLQDGQYDRALTQLRVWQATGTLSDDERAYANAMVTTALPLAGGGNIETLEQLGEVRMAVMFARVLDRFDDHRLGLALRTIAGAEGRFGQYQAARATLQEAAAVLDRTEEGRRHLHLIHDDIGWNAFLQGDIAAARRAFAQSDAARVAALALGPDVEPPVDRAWRLLNRVGMALDTGAQDAVPALLEAARQALAEAGADDPWPRASAQARLEGAVVSLAIARGTAVDLAPLVAALDAMRAAMPRPSPDFAIALSNAADSAMVAGDFTLARRLLAEAVALNAQTLPDYAPQALAARTLLGQQAMIAGDRAEAIAQFRAVTQAYKAPVNREGLAEASTVFEQFAWLLLDSPGRDDAAIAEAFEALQWTQITRSAEALTFLETRLSVADPRRGGLLRERQVLMARYEAATRALMQQGRGPAEGATEAATAEIERIATDLARVDTSLDALGLQDVGLGTIRPVPLAEAQAMLAPGEMLLSFVLASLKPELIPGLDGPANLAIGVTRDSVTVARMGEVSRSALAARVAAYRCVVAVHEPGCGDGAAGTRGAMSAAGPQAADSVFDFVAGHALYRDLFGDLAGPLAQSTQVIVAPPADLLPLPFAALLTAEPAPGGTLAGAPWMIRQNALAVLPAITSLRALRGAAAAPDAPRSMIGFADPVIGNPASVNCAAIAAGATRALPPDTAPQFGAVTDGIPLADVGFLARLPRLPDSACEVQAIARGFPDKGTALLTGAAATETEVKALDAAGTLGGYDVLIFATHGLMAGESGAAAPGLVLTPPATASLQDDGLLTAGEIAMLSLNADLVVLSACNTAAGDGGDADGLSGLARAFFQAGARALLVTQWSIYSDAAVELTTGLFAGLGQQPGAQGAALRRSVLAILDDPARPPFQQHPAYWAAFTLVGAG
ncbi:MAG: CHAT domain-containing protein [Roseivivax sp.]|nr:CHAT domain-containing protein [Roseivivax sp.]